MTVSALESAVESYTAALTILESSVTTHPSKQQILDVLEARDEVYTALNDKTQTSKEILMKVIFLDERLKKTSWVDYTGSSII